MIQTQSHAGKSKKIPHFEAEAVKSAASGRWPEILERVAGIGPQYLTGEHGPCPKGCDGGGGSKRWRYGNDQTGWGICNHCLKEENGDGLAVIQWFTGWTFPETLARVAEYLNVPPSGRQKPKAASKETTKPDADNGKARANGEPETNGHADKELALHQLSISRAIGSHPFDDLYLIYLTERKKGILFQSIVDAGGLAALWTDIFHRPFSTVAFPAYNQRNADPSGYLLLRNNAEDFPPAGKLKERNKHNLAGSTDGFVIVGGFNRFDSSLTVWKCEGVPDALALHPHLPDGHVAVTNICGAGSIGNLPLDWFAGKTLHVIPDADITGQKGAKKLAGRAAHHAESVRLVNLPYEITENKGKDLRDWLNEGGTFEQLQEMAEAVEPVEPAKQKPNKKQPRDSKTDDESIIDIGKSTPTQAVLRRITERLLDAGNVYRREGFATQIRGDNYTAVTSSPALAGVLSQTTECGFFNNSGEFCYDPLPPKFANTWLNNAEEVEQLPEITMFTRNPVFTLDWRLTHPGYDVPTGIYYAGEVIEPTTGTHHLEELLRDFCFKSPGDRTNFLAMLLTAVLANHFVGSKPGAILNGNQPELGKSILAQIIAIIRDGRHVETCSYTDDDTEFEKRLGARVRTGATTIIIDNAKGSRGRNCTVDSGCLERSITDPVLSYRLLTRSEEIRAENSHLFCITVNAAEVSRDIVTRCVPINLYHEGEPTARRFSLQDPEGYALDHRHELLAELLGMVERWKASGMPLSDAKSRFNKKGWAKIVGGILEANGEEDFLANVDEAAKDFDPVRREFSEIVEIIAKVKDPPSAWGWKPSDLAAIAEQNGLFKRDLADRSDSGKSMVIGHLASRFVGQKFVVDLGGTFDGESPTTLILKKRIQGRNSYYETIAE